MSLEKPKQLVQYTVEELKEVMQPIQKATFIKDEGKLIRNPSDRIKCEYCDKTYRRSNKDKHVKTQIHQLHERINKTLRQIIIDNKKPQN